MKWTWITRPDPFRWFHFITFCLALYSVRIKTDTDRQTDRQAKRAGTGLKNWNQYSLCEGGAKTPLRTLALSTPKQNYVHTYIHTCVCMCICHVSISREKSARRAAAHGHFASCYARLIMQLFFLYGMHTCACMCVYDIISGQALLWCHNI